MFAKKKLTKEQKAVRALKAKLPLAKPTLRPLNKLRAEADDWFSWYVRLRDSHFDGQEWTGTCITCSKTGVVAYLDPATAKKRKTGAVRYTNGWDAGHFVTRGHLIVRFNEQNVNLQDSYRCNRMRSGEYEKYRLALKLKYGDEIPEELETWARKYPTYKLSREELEEVIENAKEYIGQYNA